MGVIVVNTPHAPASWKSRRLMDLLKSGHVGHYATDVFAKEPVDPNEPLLKLANVTLTSHAAHTPRGAMTMYRRASRPGEGRQLLTPPSNGGG